MHPEVRYNMPEASCHRVHHRENERGRDQRRAIEARTPMKAMTAPAAAPVSPIERAPKAAPLEVFCAALPLLERDGLEEPLAEPPVGLAPFEPVAVALGEMDAKKEAAEA